MNRTEWLIERKKGIGGSDAAAVIGLNPYMTNVDLWEIKTERKKQADISSKDCVQYGIAAEPLLRDMYKLDYPELMIVHDGFKTVQNSEYYFIRGSFDGIITVPKINKKGVLEFKTTNILRSSQLEKWENKIPQNYYIQVLHYFLVDKDFDFAVVKAKLRLEYKRYFNGIYDVIPSENREYIINRYDEQVQADLKYLFEKEKEFWRYVETDTRPPLILPNVA